MKVTVDGIEIELTNEQVKEIETKKREKENPFSRVPYREEYYYINDKYNICKIMDINDRDDEEYHNNANYCSNKGLIQQRAYWLQLEQLLWRDCCISNKRNIRLDYYFYIVWDSFNGVWSVVKYSGNYRSSLPSYICEEDAEKAIDNIVIPFCEKHPGFIK